MSHDQLEFQVQQSIKHQQSILNTLAVAHQSDLSGILLAQKIIPKHPILQFIFNSVKVAQDAIGGVLRNGRLGWTALGPHIAVVSLKTGNIVSSYNFESAPQCGTTITCVCEVDVPAANTCILAICLRSVKQSGKVCLFAVQGSRRLRTIEIVDKVTGCCFIRSSACQNSELRQFDGCLAIGTDIGQIILIDLDLDQCKDVLYGKSKANNDVGCLLTLATVGSNEMRRQLKFAKNSDMNFGIRMEALPDACPVISILSLPPLRSLAIGMSDGRMILYNLNDLKAFHLAHPPEQNSPLIKMAYIEPADDPRACVYIWAFHANAKMSIAVMHSLMYSTKIVINTNEHEYKNFQACSPRLTMPIYGPHSFPIACQSVSKNHTDDDDNVVSLCLLTWTARARSHMCVFDLNQWYKEQMPPICDMRHLPTYLAVFPLDNPVLLDVWMDRTTVTPFSSIQRPDEHFYPVSLSFDCISLSLVDCKYLHWAGLQNRTLDLLSGSGSNAILEPNRFFAEAIHATLIPQFVDYNFNTHLSTQMKQEFLLSIALEYNCVGLLRDCARAWADGSHMGQHPTEGLTLSTLTDWIWNRASLIKERCNSLCISLFDHSGITMGLREQKVLLNCSRQLKTLSELLTMILATCQQFIPNAVLDTLKSQRNSICMAFEYQEVLQWLLNMGLLPEGAPTQYLPEKTNAVPYPYRVLRNYYMTQRQKFKAINSELLTSRRSCKVLYIDAFIENECNPSILRSEWRKGTGDGLYPPPSLQSMLRTLLVPGVSIANKYMLFVYLFLDLSIALKDDVFVGVVQKLIKFPAVFRLNPALIKTTQAFWNLDHGQFKIAIEDLTSPLTRDHQLLTWQQELLIESLLLQEVPQLALRVLRAPGSAIAPVLAIRTLLANDLVTEAFQLQRTKADERLLFEFFRSCHEHQQWHLVLDLALTDAEEQCLGEFLRTSDSSLGENLHFLYLLQRSKYIEAVAFMADLQQQRQSHRSDLETPNTILSAYKLTMTPATRQMSDIYYSLRDNIDNKLNHDGNIPNPLSSKLLQRKLDLLGGVYHRSVLSTEQTTLAPVQTNQSGRKHLTPNTVPFLRNPQYLMFGSASQQQMHNNGISFPVPFVHKQKRNLRDAAMSMMSGEDNDKEEDVALQGQRKRRRIVGPDLLKPLTVLTAFKERLSVSMVRCNDSVIPEPDHCSPETVPNTVLTTPVVLSSRKLRSAAMSPQSVTKRHSILKVKGAGEASPMTTPRRRSVSPFTLNDRGRSMDSDEKSIRFYLPQRLLDSLPAADNEDECDEENEANQVTQNTPIEIIVESQADDTAEPLNNSSMMSTSGEEYFSPKSFGEKVLDSESEVLSAYSLADGPKARKRLRSGISASPDKVIAVEPPTPTPAPKTKSIVESAIVLRKSTRSRSKTPEVRIPTRRSARSRSKTPDADTISTQKVVAQSSTPMRRKPLSRLVLEANAKKVIAVDKVAVLPPAMEFKPLVPTTAVESSFDESWKTDSLTANVSAPTTSSNHLVIDSTMQFLDRWNVDCSKTSNSSFASSDDEPLNLRPSCFDDMEDSDASFVEKLKVLENVHHRPVERIIPVQLKLNATEDNAATVVAEKVPELEISVETVEATENELACGVGVSSLSSSLVDTESNENEDEENNKLYSFSTSSSASEEGTDIEEIIVLSSSSDGEESMEDLQLQDDNVEDEQDDDFEDLDLDEEDDELQLESSENYEDDDNDDMNYSVGEEDNVEDIEIAAAVRIQKDDDDDVVQNMAHEQVGNVRDVEMDIYSDLAATDLKDQDYGKIDDYDEEDTANEDEMLDDQLNEAVLLEAGQSGISIATTLCVTSSVSDAFNEALLAADTLQADFEDLSEAVDLDQRLEGSQTVTAIDSSIGADVETINDEETGVLDKGCFIEDTAYDQEIDEHGVDMVERTTLAPVIKEVPIDDEIYSGKLESHAIASKEIDSTTVEVDVRQEFPTMSISPLSQLPTAALVAEITIEESAKLVEEFTEMAEEPAKLHTKVVMARADPAFGEPAPVEPAPADPSHIDPAERAPIEPAPIEPAPIEPAPIEPAPIEPVPIEPVPAEPAPAKPAPAKPAPAKPAPSELAHSEPVPTKPAPEEPATFTESKPSSIVDQKNSQDVPMTVVLKCPETTIDDKISEAIGNKTLDSVSNKQANHLTPIAENSTDDNEFTNEQSTMSGSGRILRVTRARSISIDAQHQVSPSTTPRRRSDRSKSIEHNISATESPVTTRKDRSRSEPRTPAPLLTRGKHLHHDSESTVPSVEVKVEVHAEPSKRRARKPKASTVADVDDTASVVSASSVASSVVSTRTTRSRRKAEQIKEENEDDEDDNRSINSLRSGKSVNVRGKKTTANILPIISEEAAEQSAEYSDSRRLTRHQISLMRTIKKNMAEQLALNALSSTRQKHSIEDSTEVTAVDDNSDADSVSSTVSRRSNASKSKPTRQKMKRQKKKDGDSEKVSIDTTSPKLETIPESDDDDDASKDASTAKQQQQRQRKLARK